MTWRLETLLVVAFCVSSTHSQRVHTLGLLYNDPVHKACIDVAVEEVNSLAFLDNGDTLEVLATSHVDCSTSAGVSAGETFVSASVTAVVGGGCDLATKAAALITSGASIPQIGFSSMDPALESGTVYPFFTRTVPSFELEMAYFAELAARFKWQRLAILHTDDDLSSSLAGSLQGYLTQQKRHFELYLKSWATNAVAANIQPLFRGARELDLRVFILLGNPAQVQEALLAAHAEQTYGEGYALLLSLDDIRTGTSSDPSREAALHQTLEGALGVRLAEPDPPSEVLQRLISRTAHVTGGSVVPFGAYAYDAVWAVARAIRLCQSSGVVPERDALMGRLRSLAFRGAAGAIDLTAGSPFVPMEVVNIGEEFLFRRVGLLLGVSQDSEFVLTDIIWPGGLPLPPSSRIYRVGVSCHSTFSSGVSFCDISRATFEFVNRYQLLTGGDTFDPVLFEGMCSHDAGAAAAANLTTLGFTALVGSMCSPNVIGLHSVFGEAHIVPIISNFATMGALENADNYPSFLRTVFPDDPWNVLRVVLGQGWRRVTFLVLDEVSPRTFASIAKHLFQMYGIAVDSIIVSTERTPEHDNQVAQDLIEARVVLLFMYFGWYEGLKDLGLFQDAKPQAVIYCYVDEYGDPLYEGSLALQRSLATIVSPELVAIFSALSQELLGTKPPDYFFGAGFDAVMLLRQGILTVKQSDPHADARGSLLMNALRHTSFLGVTGRVQFSTVGSSLNNRIGNVSVLSVINVQQLQWEVVGSTPSLGKPIAVADGQSLKWPGGTTTPIACMRGTHGHLSSNKLYTSCIPCAMGSYAATLDASDCQPCSVEDICPFAWPSLPLQGSKWRVGASAVYPTAGLPKMSPAQRLQKLVPIVATGASLLIIVLVVVVFLYSYSTSTRKQTREWLREFDVFFRDCHYELPRFPLTKYRTAHGGFLAIVATIAMTFSAVSLLYYVYELDPSTVDFASIPDIARFRPRSSMTLQVSIYIVGLDRSFGSCSLFCDPEQKRFASTIADLWDLVCVEDVPRAGCRVDMLLKSGLTTTLPPEFSLSLDVSLARVHSWQCEIESVFRRDGVEYSASANATAPSGKVFFGNDRSIFDVELRPTSYETDIGTTDYGYVPFVSKATLGETVNATDFFPSLAPTTSSGAQVEVRCFLNDAQWQRFTLVQKWPILEVLTLLFSISLIIVVIFSLGLQLYEYLRTTYAKRTADILEHRKAQIRRQLLIADGCVFTTLERQNLSTSTSRRRRGPNQAMMMGSSALLIAAVVVYHALQPNTDVHVPPVAPTTPSSLRGGLSHDTARRDLAALPPSTQPHTQHSPPTPLAALSPRLVSSRPTSSAWFNATRNAPAPAHVRAKTYKLGLLSNSAITSAASRVAVQEINALGYLGDGDTLEFVAAFDNVCTLDGGAAAGRAFLDSGVEAVVGGGCSLASRASYEITAEQRIPQVAFSSTSPLFDAQDQFPFFSRTCPSGTLQVLHLASIIIKQAWQRISILYGNEVYGAELARGLREQLLADSPTRDICLQSWENGMEAADIQPKVRVCKELHHKVFVILGLGSDIRQGLLAAHAEQVTGSGYALLFMEDLLTETGLTSALAEAAVGSIAVRLAAPSPPSELLQRLISNTADVLGTVVPYGAFAYDAVWTIARAIRICKRQGVSAEKDALLAAIRSLAFKGAAGEIDLRLGFVQSPVEVINVAESFIFRRIGMIEKLGSSVVLQPIAWPGGGTVPPTARLYSMAVTCSDATYSHCDVLNASVRYVNDNDLLGGGDQLLVHGVFRDMCGSAAGNAALPTLRSGALFAVIGSMCSSSAVALSKGLDHKTPVISGSSTLPDLANSDAFPYFIRTAFPDRSLPILQIALGLGWRSVCFVALDDLSARAFSAEAQDLFNRRGITVSQYFVSFDASEEEKQQLERQTKECTAYFLFVYNGRLPLLQDFLFSGDRKRASVMCYVDEVDTADLEGNIGLHRRLRETVQSAMFAHVSSFIKADLLAYTTFDTLQLLIQGILLAKTKTVVNVPNLMLALRDVEFVGVTGLVAFPAQGTLRNDRVGNVSSLVLINAQSLEWVEVAPIPELGDTLEPFEGQVVSWPNGGSGCPLACPRGTSGVVVPNGLSTRCTPCQVGTYSAQLDSAACLPCSSSQVCPFAWPALPLEGEDWLVPSAAKYPVTALSLGKDEDRVSLIGALTGILGLFLMVFVGTALFFLFAKPVRHLRPKAAACIRKMDWLFRDIHFERPYFPTSRFRGIRGGVLSVVVGAFAVAVATFFIVQGLVIDRLAVTADNVPGLLLFPHLDDVHLTVSLSVVGLDPASVPDCSRFCSAPATILHRSPQPSWRVGCRSVGPVCHTDFRSSSDGVLPKEFWINSTIPQGRVHSWQFGVTSTFRDEHSPYLTDINITAPLGMTLAGGSRTRVVVELRPTSYTSSAGKEVFGYVPYIVERVLGSVVDQHSFFDSGEPFETSIEIQFVTLQSIFYFTESSASAITLLLSLLTLLYGLISFARATVQLSIVFQSISDEAATARLQAVKEMLGVTDEEAKASRAGQQAATLAIQSRRAVRPRTVVAAGTATMCIVALVCLVGWNPNLTHPASATTAPLASAPLASTPSATAPLASPRLSPTDAASASVSASASAPSAYASPSVSAVSPTSASPSAVSPAKVVDVSNERASSPRPITPHAPNTQLPNDAPPTQPTTAQPPRPPATRAVQYRLGLMYTDEIERISAEYALQDINSLFYLGDGDTLLFDDVKYDACSEAGGTVAGESFLSSNVIAVAGGGCSRASLAAYQQTSRNRIPMVAFSSTSTIFDDRETFPFFTRACPSDVVEAAAVATLVKTLHWQRMGIFYADEVFGRGLAHSLRDLLQQDYKTVHLHLRPWTPGASSLSIQPLFQQAKQDHITVFVLFGFGVDVLQAMAAAQAAGTVGYGYSIVVGTDTFYSLRSGDFNATHVRLASTGALGVQVTAPSPPGEVLQRLISRTAHVAGTTVVPYGAFAYDAVWALARAIRICKANGVPPVQNALMAALRSLAFRGAAGEIDLGAGSPNAPMEIINVGSEFQLRRVGLVSSLAAGVALESVTWPGGATTPPSARVYSVGVTCSDAVSNDCHVVNATLAYFSKHNMLGGGDVFDTGTVAYRHMCGKERAQQVLTQLLARGVDVVLGGMCSSSVLELHHGFQTELGRDRPAVPIISTSSTLPDLADTVRFPYFVRTIFSDKARPLLQIALAFGWRRVSFLALDDLSALDFSAETEAVFRASGISVQKFVVGLDATPVHLATLATELDSSSALFMFYYNFRLETLQPLFAQGVHRALVMCYVDEFGPPDVVGAIGMHRTIEGAQSEIYDNLGLSSTERFFHKPAFDAVQLVLEAVRKAKREWDRVVHGDVLMDALRTTSFMGITGHVAFPQTGTHRNDRVELANGILLVNCQGDEWIQVAPLPPLHQPVQAFETVMWPGAKPLLIPVACPRGTSGVVVPNGLSTRCTPCQVGTYSAQLDSAACLPCSSSQVCPFAWPALPLEGEDWLVPSAAKYPVTALSLGKDEDRNRLMLGIGAAVGCVLSVFVMVVLASVFGDSPSSRLKAKDLLRRCDFLFRAAHYYRPHFPIARYRTVLGGFLTVLVVLTLTSSLLFFVFQSAVIDRLSVQFKEIPGRLVFNPSHVNLTFQLFAVGIDTETLPCHAICESEENLEVSQGSGWRFECRNASVHRACLIQGYFNSTVEREGGPLADASRLHLRIEQAALHSWQTVVSSRFRRDGQDYLSSSNLTAPPGAVFAGASPSLLTFRMRPTVYEHASGQRDQGYVPFLVSAQLGDTVLASPNASDPQAHYFRSVFGSGVSLDIRLDVERHTNWFFEVPQFPILAIFSTVTAVVSGLIRFCKLIVTAWEFYKLRKTKSQRRAQVSHLGHLSAQQRIARNILAGVCGEDEHEEGAAHDDADVDSDKGHGGGHGHGNSGGGGHGHGGKATQSQGDKSQIRPSDWAGFKERPRSRSQSSHATSHSSASERKARRGNNGHHGNGVGVVGVEPEKARLAWEDPMAGEETVTVSGIGVERQSNGNGHGAASEAPAGSEWESASTPLVGLGIERVTEDGSHASVEQVHVKVPMGVVHAGTLDGEDSSGMLYVDEHSETMSVGWEGDLEMSEMGVWAYM